MYAFRDVHPWPWRTFILNLFVLIPKGSNNPQMVHSEILETSWKMAEAEGNQHQIFGIQQQQQ